MRAGDSVWGVGDVTGNGAFTHMAMYEADVAVRDILGQGGPGADYRARPRVTFTDPEIGAVGLTEKQARDAGIDVQVGFVEGPAVSRGFIHGPGNDGFIKVVADGARGVLVGATSVGPAGGEVLGALSLAVHAEIPVSTLQSTIWAYPTFHRGIGDALKALR
jgi:pyruvate/2-oxoglutarate dehydrogenase complex dihydrolipoamide dehydrogenase (E3) component